VSYLIPITRFSKADNLGGLIAIKVARKVDVQSHPDPVDGVVYGDITFFPGKGFISWDVTSESAGATSQARPSREGSSRGNRLPFSVPKDREDLRLMFELAEEDEFIVQYIDANGKSKLFGLLDAPVKFKFDHDSGKAHSDSNHYECEFYYTGPENMFSYNGAISVAPAGTAPAIVKYNGDPIASLAPGEILNIISEFGITDFYITS
jgi:hypothetical protein